MLEGEYDCVVLSKTSCFLVTVRRRSWRVAVQKFIRNASLLLRIALHDLCFKDCYCND